MGVISTDSSSDTDLHEELKPLEDVLESTQYRKLEYMCTRNYKVKSNWKVRSHTNKLKRMYEAIFTCPFTLLLFLSGVCG